MGQVTISWWLCGQRWMIAVVFAWRSPINLTSPLYNDPSQVTVRALFSCYTHYLSFHRFAVRVLQFSSHASAVVLLPLGLSWTDGALQFGSFQQFPRLQCYSYCHKQTQFSKVGRNGAILCFPNISFDLGWVFLSLSRMTVIGPSGGMTNVTKDYLYNIGSLCVYDITYQY